MCIYFLSSECPTAGFDEAMPSSLLYDSSRRGSTDGTMSSTQSNMSSRSSVITMSSQSNASSESLHELGSIKEDTALNVVPSMKHYLITTSSESENYPTNGTIEGSAVNAYISAMSTLTNMLENKSGVEVGRCLDPTSPVPSQCKNFQIRHRSSSKRQTGYFDKCFLCTKVGKQWQNSREDEDVTSEQLSQTSSRAQKVKKAETGMCSTKGCEGCRPAKS